VFRIWRLFIAAQPLEVQLLYLANTWLGQDHSMHAKIFTLSPWPQSLCLCCNICVKDLKIVHSSTTIRTTTFIFGKHIHSMHACDLDLDLRVCIGFKICFSVSKIIHNTSLIFGTHMHLSKTFPCVPKLWPQWPWLQTPSTRPALLSSGNSCSNNNFLISQPMPILHD